MAPETRETLVGAVVVLALFVVLGFSYGGGKAAARSAATGYLVEATFNRIDGLAVGDEVRLGGVRIGTVEDQVLGGDYRATVTLRLESPVPLPTDTAAAIHTDGLFGSKYVELQPGAEEDMLADGDVLHFTQDAVIVGELLELIITEGRKKRAWQGGVQ